LRVLHARKLGGNERQGCNRSDRGKHEYGEPLGGVTEPGTERTAKSAAPTGMAAPHDLATVQAASVPALGSALCPGGSQLTYAAQPARPQHGGVRGKPAAKNAKKRSK